MIDKIALILIGIILIPFLVLGGILDFVNKRIGG